MNAAIFAGALADYFPEQEWVARMGIVVRGGAYYRRGRSIGIGMGHDEALTFGRGASAPPPSAKRAPRHRRRSTVGMSPPGEVAEKLSLRSRNRGGFS